ncbi:hypothetical protein A3724_02670 [Alcanivorax sp. HI0033]|uniref:hypothetical protein n=1 Tax=unclassified Alcanivorax TaxID=2638842 RepID=UPI0007BAB5D6|nr:MULTISPECIES: hypothetical protein [unclassified Alcanivorax]KZX76962.1 hypothetical protein A3716_10000 [Alcanivorax sp. HI0011]KZX92094.1 hypothetical protein A3717_16175 [Alcanivorax sp. HI0013]KZY08700.1 hypothetical protein A3725_23935 [Alcanivorax sp. HI0035]KZX66758.1 hypothetical protein A3714_13030 [Alcanivorax sp. HI0007]KZX69040.1 hypothetical protein A3713_16015 [Alcanivorax sp. HI0003]
MKDNYLVHGTNAIKGGLRYLEGDDYRYEPKSVSIYLSSACKTLSYLAEDENALKKIAKGMQGVRENNFYEFENLFEEFIKPDHALMIAAGMDEKMAAYFFRDVEAMRDLIDQKADVGSELLRERIKELRYSVCESGMEGHVGGRSPLWRSAKVIGGGAIVTTNYAADTIIGGLASTFSQTFGGYLVGKGLDG